MSRRSYCPRDPSDLFFQVKLRAELPANFLIYRSCFATPLQFNMTFTEKSGRQARPFPAGVVILSFDGCLVR